MDEFKTKIAVTVLLLSIGFGITWAGAMFEANSYNKFCETPVSTWDALWLDLRIDECSN